MSQNDCDFLMEAVKSNFSDPANQRNNIEHTYSSSKYLLES